MRFVIVSALICLPVIAAAQGISRPPPGLETGAGSGLDCSNPINQIEMTACAERVYQQEDRALNAAYGDAMAKARGITANNGVSAADMLRDAQRAWIPFRDKACAAEAQLAWGGR